MQKIVMTQRGNIIAVRRCSTVQIALDIINDSMIKNFTKEGGRNRWTLGNMVVEILDDLTISDQDKLDILNEEIASVERIIAQKTALIQEEQNNLIALNTRLTALIDERDTILHP